MHKSSSHLLSWLIKSRQHGNINWATLASHAMVWSVSGNSAPSCAQSARTPWTFCLQRDLSTETELLWCLWHLSPHCCFTFLSCSTLSSEKLCWSRNTLSLFSGVSYWQFSSAIIANATSALLHNNKEAKISCKFFKVLGTKIRSCIWHTLLSNATYITFTVHIILIKPMLHFLSYRNHKVVGVTPPVLLALQRGGFKPAFPARWRVH